MGAELMLGRTAAVPLELNRYGGEKNLSGEREHPSPRQ